MSRNKPPFAGIDLATARVTLAGTAIHPLHTDWVAIDPGGHYAVFLGDESSGAPLGADVEGTSKLVETIRASFDGLSGPSMINAAYRMPEHRAREPIFDVPRADAMHSLHEEHYSGYPHLVVATTDGAAIVRQAMVDLGGRELLSRGLFAVAVELGLLTYEELHDAHACAGCRVLDEPNDPRARSPELLASVGFYVYGFSKGWWVRITSPAVVADASDVVAIGGAGVGAVAIRARFEDAHFLRRTTTADGVHLAPFDANGHPVT